jgi:predicted fused transcriptional regulator/phosphomethylpyrimidine kinase
MKRWPGIRAATVLAYSGECVARLEELGPVLKVGPHCCPERLLDDIREAVDKAVEEPVAVASLGGLNLEPVIYVFGRTAVEAVEKALKCLRIEES